MAGLRQVIVELEAGLRDSKKVTGKEFAQYIIAAFKDVDRRLTKVEKQASLKTETQAKK